MILFYTGLINSVFLFQIGYVDNYYLKMISMLYFYVLNEIWLPITYTILQKNDMAVSIFSIFLLFENLSACFSTLIVGYLITILKDYQLSIFPFIIVSMIISCFISLILGKKI